MTMTTTEEPCAALKQQPEELASTESSESTTTTTTAKDNSKTPPRHSYAENPKLTPITSIKRPRSARNLMRPSPNSSNSSSTPSSSSQRSLSSVTETPMSPMHGIKAVIREETATADDGDVTEKIDGIFSPVYHFLDKQHHHHEGGGGGTNSVHSESDDDDDDDASMAGPGHPAEDDEEFNPWQFIASLPPYDAVKALTPAITLPALLPEDRKTVVLDLDETLVHCSVDAPAGPPADFTFPVTFHGILYTVHVRLRPFLREFLQKLNAVNFEVIVFTASQKVYADSLLDLIDPDHKYIHHRLFRESCLAVEGNFLKDLNVLGRDLSRTVLVDNSPHAFGYQISNGIPIESWFDDGGDRELLKLEKFLRRRVLPAADVRVPIRHKFQLHKLVSGAAVYGG